MDGDHFFVLAAGVVLGLMIGSFLNVVIHRLPRMMDAQWANALREHTEDNKELENTSPPAPYNLAVPSSACPHCGHVLRWHENIPVFSYLALRGRCNHCKQPISWRYPAIEVFTSVLFAGCFAKYGLTFTALAWSGFAAALVALAAIDADTTLLPDDITQPLVWAGLLAAALGLTTNSLTDALWGATAGYLFLWTVYWVFRLITGKEGMGYGDFKLLAGLGAWLGWPALASLVLIASVSGAMIGLWLRARQRLVEGGYMPFGPFLVIAGLWVMFYGPLPFTMI